MIIQRLLDNYNVEKNQKETMETVLNNKEKEFFDIKKQMVLI